MRSMAKKSNIGGFRKKKVLPFRTQRLLEAIWKIKGGPRLLEKITNVKAQKFIHWRNRGYVSYKKLGHISRKLELPIAALDFNGISDLFGDAAPTWVETLQKLKLPSQVKKYINEGKK